MSSHPFIDPELKNRHRQSKVFKSLTWLSLALTIAFLLFFLVDITSKALPAFQQTYVSVDVDFNEKAVKTGRKAVSREDSRIVSRGWLRTIPALAKEQPELVGTREQRWVLADDQVDQYVKGHYHTLKDSQVEYVESLKNKGLVELRFNRLLFTNGDSKLPEFAGLHAAIFGSIATMAVTMGLAFPLGVMTAIYLEEFAKDNVLNHFIEVNINNLAAIPSILFGLLGLSVFINLFGLPRSSPLVGGITLALMTLPIIIVSARAALRSVPASIRQAGYGLGLTKLQVVGGHVLPVAMPGILTGSIIGLAQAIGETAPLIIIGMIAFIPEAPTSIVDSATVLPAQIFTWAGMPERAYVEKTAAGIVVILMTLVVLNAAAVYLRKKYEIKW